MTRFARAKGSKSSNERICEEATSWHEMKNQLLEKKKGIEDEVKRKKVEEMRNSNYQKFLKDKEKEAANGTEWADFPNVSENLNDKNEVLQQPQEKTNENKKQKDTKKRDYDIDSGIDTKSNLIEEIETVRKMTKVPKLEKGNCSIEDDAPLEISSKVEVTKPKVKKCKQKKKKLSIVIDHTRTVDIGVETKRNETKTNNELENTSNHNKQMRKIIDMDSLTEAEKKKIQKKLERRKRQVEKKKIKQNLKRQELEKIKGNGELKPTGEKQEKSSELVGCPNDVAGQSETFTKRNDSFRMEKISKHEKNKTKKEKLKNGDFKRRKHFQPDKMLINGKEVDIAYFDGFPIKRDDAENLKKLKKEMISKGLPRSEINRTLKLERRKAEKALTREKKNVCFNCRKFGHNLSECPGLSNADGGELIQSTGTGICFKCGSTEHTSFACRVVQGSNFKFATCFICKEQGHISRQCPDNARGLYPKGGSCKTCGDVTHLKKDCLKFRNIQEKEQEKFQVEAISIGNPEDIDEGTGYVAKNVVKPNKIVKF